jgi:putative ABC transport system substrate-binding protein
MRLIGLAVVLTLSLALAPLAADAQQTGRKMPRIGVLMFAPMAGTFQEAFRQGLRDHGYVKGQNILVEWRAADGNTDRAKTFAVERRPLRARGRYVPSAMQRHCDPSSCTPGSARCASPSRLW